MRLINANNSKPNGIFTFPRTIPLLIILSLFLLAAALPSGQASPQEMHGWPISCPTEKAGEWSAEAHFPSASVPLAPDDHRRAVPFLINTNNGGRYHFFVQRMSGNPSTKFKVGVFHDVVRDFIQTTPRPPKWIPIVLYAPSYKTKDYGDAEVFYVPEYFSEASKSGVAQVWVLLMIYPEDQATPSSYRIWYHADQCSQGDGPKPAPAGCSWTEVTVLGAQVSWECICAGKPADPKRCGPRPR